VLSGVRQSFEAGTGVCGSIVHFLSVQHGLRFDIPNLDSIAEVLEAVDAVRDLETDQSVEIDDERDDETDASVEEL